MVTVAKTDEDLVRIGAGAGSDVLNVLVRANNLDRVSWKSLVPGHGRDVNGNQVHGDATEDRTWNAVNVGHSGVAQHAVISIRVTKRHGGDTKHICCADGYHRMLVHATYKVPPEDL